MYSNNERLLINTPLEEVKKSVKRISSLNHQDITYDIEKVNDFKKDASLIAGATLIWAAVGIACAGPLGALAGPAMSSTIAANQVIVQQQKPEYKQALCTILDNTNEQGVQEYLSTSSLSDGKKEFFKVAGQLEEKITNDYRNENSQNQTVLPTGSKYIPEWNGTKSIIKKIILDSKPEDIMKNATLTLAPHCRKHDIECNVENMLSTERKLKFSSQRSQGTYAPPL